MRIVYTTTFLIVCCWSSLVQAELVVKGLRMWEAPERSRIVFDLNNPANYQIGTVGNPNRVYIDIQNASLGSALPAIPSASRYVQKVHSGSPTPGTLRIVFTLKKPATPKHFQLKPNDVYGYRLVLDLYQPGTVNQNSSLYKKTPSSNTTTTVKVETQKSKSKQFVVAIDAGHGGEDPGAIGKRRTKEKQITLLVAKELQRIINKDPDMRGVLIRTGDYYIALRRRTAIARREQADVFVSIHADAFRQRSVRGSSVYTLSEKGASSENARWLSDKENSADLIGGVKLKDKEDTLASVLLDMTMTKTISDSRVLAKDVLDELGRIGKVHSRKVEYAGFAVLKSPDIPSVLVETAFLSNPQEEQLLRTSSHRKRIANAIYQGLRRYYQRVTPGAKPALYVVKSGDTLSDIASRYGIKVSVLKSINGLKSDTVRIGQRLKLRQ